MWFSIARWLTAVKRPAVRIPAGAGARPRYARRSMLPTDHLLAFVLVAFVLVLVPGPSVLFVVTRSLTLGRGAGIATVVGNTAGVYVQVVPLAFGLGALVQESIAAYTAVKLAGAAYLVFLGVQTFRHRRS